MKWLVGLAVVLGVAVVGFAVVLSGVVPARASSGHWAVTAWFLDFAKKRSVATNSLGVEAPPIDEPWQVVKGAGHYEGGCFPCHGSPEVDHPRVAAAMTPHPPRLAEVVKEYSPEELFYIVKHGIKFTGMPAWPSQERDDEVWAMVAFLVDYPGLDGRAYRQLVDGEVRVDQVMPLRHLEQPGPAVPDAVLANCARCHGTTGHGRGLGAFPALAGQNERYFINAMRAYASGKRHSGIMEPIAAGLDARAWEALASHYRAKGRRHTATVADEEVVARGALIAARGIPEWGVPACVECHGPTTHDRNPAYPELAGQYAEYLFLQLKLFKDGNRGGSPYAHLMRSVVYGLTEEDMRAVAAYYESVEP